MKDIDRLTHILDADYVVFYSAGHQWWEATYSFAKDALLQLCVSDSLFEASVTELAEKFRHRDGYDNLTEEELRTQMKWMLRNNPELIPGLDGEDMPSIRNTERIEKALAIKPIRNDKDWFTAIQMYAAQQTISIDDALQEEVNRMIQGRPLLRDEVVFDTAAFIQMKKQEIMQKWRLNNNIMQMLQQKAKERNLPLDTVFKQDVQWVINRQIENGELFQ